MDNIFITDSNSCCDSVVKVSCWLILAKYRTSKLEVIKRATEEAALDEFETRLFLRNYYVNCAQNNLFLNFTQKVYKKAMLMITDYICSPDWSMFYDEGNSSIWQLKNIIQNEIIMASSSFNYSCHPNCANLFYQIRDQILSSIESWSNVMFIYSNYVSASLSEIFNDKMKKIICKYEQYPNNGDFKWLCDEIMLNCSHDHWDHLHSKNDKNQFWFINETINLHFFDEPFTPYSYALQSEEELVFTLSHWLFRECINQLQSNTRRLVHFNNQNIDGDEDIKILRKEQLSDFLNTSVVNLELQMSMSSSNNFSLNFHISDAPHYFIPDNAITELYPLAEPKTEDDSGNQYSNDEVKFEHPVVSNTADIEHSKTVPPFDEEKSNFDLIDSILNNCKNNDTEYDCKLSNIKEELEDFCASDDKNDAKSDIPEPIVKPKEPTDKISVPRLQIKSRHELQKNDNMFDTYPAVQHKKRGRPKKIDDYSSNAPKNGQHKYSPEDVQDCSIWISDNFYEVAGNKPAIDRARMYELYTNYCLLKLCTPVDRALFGKIIRKVFPKLKSRRLIQNQVLKYHYVGLKPKYTELEQALLYSDSSSMNPSEILVTYVPVEE